MKKKTAISTYGIFIVLFVMLTSCVTSQTFIPIKGSGNAVDKKFSTTGFHGIDVSGGFDVVLVQGSNEEVTLTAQENLYDHITVKVDQGILKIYTDRNIMSTKGMKARISFKDLDNLKVSGGGDVTSETSLDVPSLTVDISGGGDLKTVVHAGEMKCHISGGGDAKIEGTAKNYELDITGGGDVKSEVDAGVLNCRISGGGDLNLKCNDKASDATIDMNGGGDASVDMNAEKLQCSISGGGDAMLSGQVSRLDVTLSGGGDVKASDMVTDNTTFHVTGGSDIHINASKEITGHISGGGNVYYSGNPGSVSIDAKGGSEVHRQ